MFIFKCICTAHTGSHNELNQNYPNHIKKTREKSTVLIYNTRSHSISNYNKSLQHPVNINESIAPRSRAWVHTDDFGLVSKSHGWGFPPELYPLWVFSQLASPQHMQTTQGWTVWLLGAKPLVFPKPNISTQAVSISVHACICVHTYMYTHWHYA